MIKTNKSSQKEEIFDKDELVLIAILLTSLIWAIAMILVANNVSNEYYNKGYNDGANYQGDNTIQTLKSAYQDNVGVDYYDSMRRYEISCSKVEYRRLP